jgi:hypothetical protein
MAGSSLTGEVCGSIVIWTKQSLASAQQAEHDK